MPNVWFLHSHKGKYCFNFGTQKIGEKYALWARVIRYSFLCNSHFASPLSLIFTSNASTNTSNIDDPSENEIRPKHTQAQAKSSEPFKLFRPEVIWIQCFHWPNISTCGKYPRACVIPERYSIFTCCSANASISACKRTKKNWILSLCFHLSLCLRQGHFDREVRIIVFALVLGSLVKSRPALRMS